MIVVDTSVLVYAVGTEHPLRDPCRALVEDASSGAIEATTTAEVIQEFAHVRARRRSREDAAAIARSYADLFAPLLVIDAAALGRGLDLWPAHERLGAFDCVLGAAALNAGYRLASADRAFSTLSGLDWLDPAANDFEARRRS